MNELLKINYENERPTVSGRELHEFLEVKTAYKDWMPRMIEYGFTENLDFCSILSESTGGRPSIDHQLTIEMAKEISMLQRNDKGKQARQYFIEVEKRYKQNNFDVSKLSPELQMFKQIFDSVAATQLQQRELEHQIVTANNRIDTIKEVVALDNTAWRAETQNLLNRIAVKLGGTSQFFQQLRNESYELLERRMGAKLDTRLTNKRRRMAEEGVCKSKRDKLSRIDIIAEDKKLVEGYLAIVKEMAIKYGIAD